MNLVFFDIECASVYKTTAKICAFGYVLCDERFNILEKEDILINPKGKFHLTDGRGEHGLVLPYKYDEFKNYPVFTQVYAKIRSLLEDKNNLIFGHATLNDVNYLDLETKRFKLAPFDFAFSDSQLMYMTSISDFTRQFGLEYITKQLDVEFTPHRAADDAYATMRVTQALCAKHGCTCSQLEELLGIKRGRIKNHRITKPDSASYAEYRVKCQREKAERAKRRNKFYCIVNSKHRAKSTKLKGKVFGFSRPFEDAVDISIPMLEKIFALGGKYSPKPDECTVYVCEEDDASVRTQNVRACARTEIITPSQLKDMLDD
ncbi:MAG: hypothetical protein K2L72_01805 [Clostridia bacterium]|nr:hypothetical protein [Clostridia bacterium]